MTNKIRQLIVISIIYASPMLANCSALPGGNVVESAIVVHTAGSKNHTVAVQLPVAASEVFATISRLIDEKPDLILASHNDRAFLIEVARGSQSMTGQVTDLGVDRSLLYVWADAGKSGMTGEELATTVVETVCAELGVDYELVNY